MKVLDLQCGYGHDFEGWFASEDDFQSQLSRRLLSCPMCGDTGVVKLPSAPRLNLGARASTGDTGQAQPDAQTASPPEVAMQPQLSGHMELQAVWLRAVRKLVAATEDVGPRFATEARRIHEGEAPERAIRGQATREETEALLDEGIPVLPLPLPPGFKNTLQ